MLFLRVFKHACVSLLLTVFAVSGCGIKFNNSLENLLNANQIEASAPPPVFSNLLCPDADIVAAAESADYYILAGTFRVFSQCRGAAPITNSTTGAALQSPLIARGNAGTQQVISDGAGGWYVGGDFRRVDGLVHVGVVHITSSGALDTTFAANIPGSIFALALDGGTLYVGGNFTTVNGFAQNRMASLNASTGALNVWNPNPDSEVRTIFIDGATMYVGGSFANIGGLARNRIAALDKATGAAIAGWNANSSSTVNSIIGDAAQLYVGGTFTTIGGLARNRIAALDKTTGAAVVGWDPNSNNAVERLVQNATMVYASGNFATVSAAAHSRVVEISKATGLATAFAPTNDASTIPGLALEGNILYMVGTFSNMNGVPRNRGASIDVTTGIVDTWDPTVNGWPLSVAVASGKATIVGQLMSSGVDNRFDRVGITLIKKSDNKMVNLNFAGGQPRSLVVSGTTLYVGGNFNSVLGTARSHLAAIDLTTLTVMPWNPNANSYVVSIVLSGGSIFAGGNFTNVNGSARNYLAEIDANPNIASPTVTAWNPGTDAQITCLATDGTYIYAGGLFTTIASVAHNRLGAVTIAGGVDSGWNPNPNVQPLSLAYSGGRLFVAGPFGTIGGAGRSRLASFSIPAFTLDAWSPSIGGGSLASVAVYGGKVYVGGSFTSIGITPKINFGVIDVVTGIATGTDLGLDSQVNWMSAAGGNLHIFGPYYYGSGADFRGTWGVVDMNTDTLTSIKAEMD